MTKQLIDLVRIAISELVTIEEYNQIKEALENYNPERNALLDALEGCGVDNWQGYSDAQELMKEWGY